MSVDPDPSDPPPVREVVTAVADLLLKQPLYSSADLSTPLGQAIEGWLKRSQILQFDTYCVGCRKEMAFRLVATSNEKLIIGGRGLGQPSSRRLGPSMFCTTARCVRDDTEYNYIFQEVELSLVKVGQFPSLATIAFGELRNLGKALDDQDREELGKALGLYAHDSSIGAFVYLRRVFERMVDRAYRTLEAEGRIVEGFHQLSMDRRVAALEGALPDAAVRNSKIFGVLSRGLHELSEQECAKYFPVVKAVLFQILEEEEHRRKAAIARRATEAALNKISSELGSDTAK